MEVSRFRELLGRPHVDGVVEHDWLFVEQRYGLVLPEDYKHFVTAYGPGCVNDQLYVFHPRAAGDGRGLRLEMLWEQATAAYAELRESAPEKYPYYVHPAPGGLIPVARSTAGNYVFLNPPQDGVEHWSVVIDMGQWIQFMMPFTEFLWAAIRGELVAPIVEGDPTYESVGLMEA
ncbi:SMI1/KNR4 family protein [Streptomyces maremycinicus]|uniref:SMI1/KNR4 family protein n=1 Tax=Streptomyces maremycinicus TaxID=1679753 RepID=UPI0013316061|nr:SMI1/KNR4 family protein [Streptomyces sp. NBRC 110468]